MLKAYLERRRLKKFLGRYVPPEVVGEMMQGSVPVEAAETVPRQIEVVLISISAVDAAQCSESLATLSRIGRQHAGMVDVLLPFALVSFGSLGAIAPGAPARFIQELMKALPGSVALVHGEVMAHVGTYGADDRKWMSVWWPGAMAAFRCLAGLEPGGVRELPTT